MADEFANQFSGNPPVTPDPGGQPSFADYFQQYQQKNPVQSDPFQNKYYNPQQVDRYKESEIYSPWIDPFADNETAAAQAQSGWEALWNGTKGSWDGIKDGFVSGAMVLPRLVGSIFSGSVEGMMDDEYGMMLSDYQQQQNQNENPIYMTADERDDIFSLKAAGEMMQNAGYTIGTVGELVAETVLTEFLAGAFTVATEGGGAGVLAATTAAEAGRWSRMMAKVRGAGRVTGEAVSNGLKFGGKTAELGAQNAMRAKTMAQSAEAIAEMSKLRDAQFGSKLTEKLYQASTKIPVLGELIETGNAMALAGKTGMLTKGELAKMGVGGIRRAYGEFQAASGEAAIEAGGTFNDVYKTMYDDFVEKNGYEPDAEEEKRMRELSKDAAVGSYGINMATLLMMNKIEFGSLMRNIVPDNAIIRAFKNEADQIYSVTGKVGGKSTTLPFSKGTLGRLGIIPEVVRTFDNGYRVAAAQYGKGLVGGFARFSVWEGLQENIQEGTLHGLTKHYQDLYNNDPSTWGEGFQEAVDSQMNKQGLKTFMMGAMTGVVTGPVVSGGLRAFDRTFRSASYKDRKDQLDANVASVKNFMLNHDKVLSEHIAKTKEYNSYNEEMQRAASNDDLYNYLNSRESALMKAVHSAKRLGNLPLLMDTVRAYGEGFDNQAFKEAFGFSAEEAGYSSPADFTSRIANDIQRYSDTYDHYMKKYANFLDLNKYIKDPNRKLATDIARASLLDAIEVVSFHENKAQDAVKRRAGIQSKLNQYKSFSDALEGGFDRLTNLNRLEEESYILQNEIQSMESLDVKTPETQKLIDQKKEQQTALKEWMTAINYKVDENTGQYSYNSKELREKDSPARNNAARAFKRYMEAHNKTARHTQTIKEAEINDAMQDVVDYMELDVENRRMVDALNMLNDPNGFGKTLQAAENARLGAHARNVANILRARANEDPVIARLLEENEADIAELERFAEAPYSNSQNRIYLAGLIMKLQKVLDRHAENEKNPENQKSRSQSNTNSTSQEGNEINTAVFQAENLQLMLDLGKDLEVLQYVNKHYIFEQISENRFSYKRVEDSRVKDPVVTHQGEIDSDLEGTFDFAVKFETDLFKKDLKGKSEIEKSLQQDAAKVKNLLGRYFKVGNYEAVIQEDDSGFFFEIYDPASDQLIDEVGIDGNTDYTRYRDDDGNPFILLDDDGNPVDLNAGSSITSTETDVNDSSINTEVQKLEDEKEEAIRDEKQKLQWNEGQRVMFEGEPGVITVSQETGTKTYMSVILEVFLNPLRDMAREATAEKRADALPFVEERWESKVKSLQRNIAQKNWKGVDQDLTSLYEIINTSIGLRNTEDSKDLESTIELLGKYIFKGVSNKELADAVIDYKNAVKAQGDNAFGFPKLKGTNTYLNNAGSVSYILTEAGERGMLTESYSDNTAEKKAATEDPTGNRKQEVDKNVSIYTVELDNGSVITLGPGESLLDEYPGLTLAPQGSTSNPEIVPVQDKVHRVEFTSDDRSNVTIDGTNYTIVRNPNTGEISGLQYQTKKGLPRVGRNGFYKGMINAVNATLAEMAEALAAENQAQLAKDILDAEANSIEVQTVDQIMNQIPTDLFNKFVLNEQLTPEEVDALRKGFENVLTLKAESKVQGPLMDNMETATLNNLNTLNAKYPPDNKPNETSTSNKSPKQAKRRGKAKSQESNDDANPTAGQKAKTTRKSKSKPTTLEAAVEQLEIQFEDAKADVRMETENKNVTPVKPVEQYEDTLDTLVSNLMADKRTLNSLVRFVENSSSTTKKSTKSRKFDVGSTQSEDTNNPFDSLGEAISCDL